MSFTEAPEQNIALARLNPAPYNPRVKLQPGDRAYEDIKRSIETFGLVDPMVWNKRTGHLVSGHQRLTILKDMDVKSTRVRVVDVPLRREKAMNVALNRIKGEFDEDKLTELLVELDDGGKDGLLEATGFDDEELQELVGDGGMTTKEAKGAARRTLAQRFVVPPFTILDARQGYWQDRKRAWLALGVAPAAGRENLGSTVNASEGVLDYMTGRGGAKGGSAFDPVLCEVAYRWFCPPKGHVLDPFAGESVKGLVAAYMGLGYTGVEVRQGQVDANEKQARAMKLSPRWVVGDSLKIKDLAAGTYDLVFTSPPYFDLEVYSKDAQDGSTKKTYADFLVWYKQVFEQALQLLRQNRFVVVKVGDVRDKKTGAYRNFVGDTIQMFLDLGLKFYNDAVLVTPLGTLPVRASAQFPKSRKLGRTHQNVLVFYKGDPQQIPHNFKKVVEYGDPPVPGEEVAS